MPDTLASDYLQVGYSYKVKLASLRWPRRVHIRSVIDRRQVVYAFFGKRKQWWHYGIESFYYFQLLLDGGLITDKQKTPSKYFK